MRPAGRLLLAAFLAAGCAGSGVYEEPPEPEEWRLEAVEALAGGTWGGDMAYESLEEAFEEPGRAVYSNWVRGEGPLVRAWWDVFLGEWVVAGADLDPSTGGISSPFHSGVRLNVDGGGGDWDFRLEFEDVRALDSPFPAGEVENRLDVSQAYVRLGVEGSRARVRLGRFRPEWGSGRVVGRGPSVSAGRSFDGVWGTFSDRFWYDRAFDWTWKADAMAGWRVEPSPESFGWGHGPFWCAGAGWGWRRWFPIEVGAGALFVRSLGEEPGELGSGPSETVVLHAGAGGEGLKKGFEFSVEGVIETGRKGGEPHFGWGTAGWVGRRFSTPWRPRVRLFMYRGSGDEDPSDGRSGRLALPLGGMDFDETGFLGRCGWPNTGSFQLRVDLSPRDDVRLGWAVRSYHLDSPRDAWIGPFGTEQARDPTGASGSDVGVEVDVWVDFLRRGGFRVRAGYGWFFPGGFLEAQGLNETEHGVFGELRALF